MLVWGSGSETKDLGKDKTKYCKFCEKERPFRIVLQYSYSHLYFLFTAIRKKKYLSLCEACHNGETLNAKETEARLGGNPIPFMRRYSGLLLVGLIVFTVIFNLVKQKFDMETYVSAPQIYDLYVVDAKLFKDEAELEKTQQYGIMRLYAFNDDEIKFSIPNVVYNDLNSVRQVIRSGIVYEDNYYHNKEILIFSPAELKTIWDSGMVERIERLEIK